MMGNMTQPPALINSYTAYLPCERVSWSVYGQKTRGYDT
jgi:hypothetical protein